MRISDMSRRAKQTIREETDERIQVARLRVLRDTVIAAAAATVLLLPTVPTPSHPNEVGWVYLLPLLLCGIAAVAAVSSRRHKSATPEMSRARAVQQVLALPLVFVITGFAVWALGAGLATAGQVAGAAAVGVGIVALFRFRRSSRGE